jgi:hypothetical protein
MHSLINNPSLSRFRPLQSKFRLPSLGCFRKSSLIMRSKPTEANSKSSLKTLAASTRQSKPTSSVHRMCSGHFNNLILAEHEEHCPEILDSAKKTPERMIVNIVHPRATLMATHSFDGEFCRKQCAVSLFPPVSLRSP